MSRYGQRTRVGQAVSAFGTAGSAGIGVVQGYGVATGGSSSAITVSSQAYTLLTFTSDTNLVVSTAGLFDVLLIGGAGSGGGALTGNGPQPGGGGGGVIGSATSAATTLTVYLPAATYAIDVGAGGAGVTGEVEGNIGLGSGLGNVVSVAGGGGGGVLNASAFAYIGRNGASTGGSVDTPSQSPSVQSQAGNIGGSGASNGFGGGGGAGGVGGNGTLNTGGTGGNGIDISGFISGSAYYAGAGGGGGAQTTGGAAGNGGVAGKTTSGGNSGVNYGAGGGGGKGTGASGAGAAGAVYIRFKV